VPTFANILIKIETWLHNVISFICDTSWIYGRRIKGFYAHVKAKCLEETIIVFKFYRLYYIVILKKDIYNKRTKKTLVVIHHYLFFLLNFEDNSL
jgi:hypothetical protein